MCMALLLQSNLRRLTKIRKEKVPISLSAILTQLHGEKFLGAMNE